MAERGRSLARVGRRVLSTVAFLLAAALLEPQGSGAETNSLLEGWFAAQANVRTWSADFVQTRKLKTLTQPLLAGGHVSVALPDGFDGSWEPRRRPSPCASPTICM